MEKNKFGGKNMECIACGGHANFHFSDYGIVVCWSANYSENYDQSVWNHLHEK